MSLALVVVDVQPDFCEGGALAVEGGNEVAHRIATIIRTVGIIYDEIVFTADRHNAPPDDNGGHFALPPREPDFVDSWPVHCVAGTPGAEIHPALKEISEQYPLFEKGQGRPDYSGFQGYTKDGVTLEEYLKSKGITEVDVVGIAGDYCVKATALDGIKAGFNTGMLDNLVVSVGGPEATEQAREEIVVANGGED